MSDIADVPSNPQCRRRFFSITRIEAVKHQQQRNARTQKPRAAFVFVVSPRMEHIKILVFVKSMRAHRKLFKIIASKVCPCVARMISWVPSIGSPPTPCRRRGHNDSDTMPTHVHTRSENCASFQKEMILGKVHVELSRLQ